ncbi:MAG: hypothetical protein K2G97_04645, partial [Oscillospiraceae bacterium]|nr:hypothetical protein [Oscillospiraceae bacterium]
KEAYISFATSIKNSGITDVNNIPQNVIENAENAMGNFIWDKASQIQNKYMFLKKDLSSGFIASLTVALIGGTSSIGEIINRSRRGYAHVGIFVGSNFGTMTGCTANGGQVTVKTLYNKYTMCGGFIGTNVGTIKDCNVTGNEICNKIYTGGYLGGFVGENIGKIENGTTTVSVTNGKYIGGFCGNNIGEISNSRSEGNVKTDAKTVTTKCGGFIGENRGIVKDSNSKGSAIGEEYVGGFCGNNSGEIVGSISEGNAKARTKDNTNRCGGFLGSNDEIGKISSCSSIGSAEGQEYVGGFCGNNKGEISKSNSEGNVIAKTVSNYNTCGGFVGNNEKGNIDCCTSKGSATGEEYVGGFVGVNKSEIRGCHASGKATAKTKTNTALAGGFVGENEKGTIIDCAAIGGSDSRSTSGQAKVGGFVGINKANIVNSKASGEVYLSAGICHKDDGCGGFVGKNDQCGNIYGCYAEATVETTRNNKGGGFVGEAKANSGIYSSKCKTKRIISKKRKTEKANFWKNKDDNAVIKNYNVN